MYFFKYQVKLSSHLEWFGCLLKWHDKQEQLRIVAIFMLGMETFRGQWHLMDTIFQKGRLLVDIPKGWLFMDTFGDISWTILVKGTLFSARLG